MVVILNKTTTWKKIHVGIISDYMIATLVSLKYFSEGILKKSHTINLVNINPHVFTLRLLSTKMILSNKQEDRLVVKISDIVEIFL